MKLVFVIIALIAITLVRFDIGLFLGGAFLFYALTIDQLRTIEQGERV